MAEIDDCIATYFAPCAVEGKTANTVASYRASLTDLRRVDEKLAIGALPYAGRQSSSPQGLLLVKIR